MPEKSHVVRGLDEIQRQIFQTLKPIGFRKRGRTFSRLVDGDLQQIINFQAGPFEIGPPLPLEASHLRPNLYRKFAVNLGVFVPEAFDRRNPQFTLPARKTAQEYHCVIRARLGELKYKDTDCWWPIETDLTNVIFEIKDALVLFGLPFLERFESRESIIEDWINFNESEQRLTQTERLDVAMIHLRLGDADSARKLFREHLREYEKAPNNPNHGDYVRELARDIGLGAID